MKTANSLEDSSGRRQRINITRITFLIRYEGY